MLKDKVVLYPSVMAKFPGVVLTRDVLAIEDKIDPHGRVKDLRVNGPQVIPAEEDEYEFGNGNDEGIIHI